MLYFCRAAGCPCISESPGECKGCGGNHEAIMRLEVESWIFTCKTERGRQRRMAKIGEEWANASAPFPR